jgi:hypothetical protein
MLRYTCEPAAKKTHHKPNIRPGSCIPWRCFHALTAQNKTKYSNNMGVEQYVDKLRKSILAKERTERPPKDRFLLLTRVPPDSLKSRFCFYNVQMQQKMIRYSKKIA